MTLPDENPGGFSPVSVNWVAGVSGPLTAPCSRVVPPRSLSRAPCGRPRTARRSPVEASGLAPLVTGLASGSSRPPGPTECHGGQGTGPHPTVECHGGQGTGPHPTVECHGGQGTGSHPTIECHGGQGTGSHPTVECHGGPGTHSRPSVRRHASCILACARACCSSIVTRGARWLAGLSDAKAASKKCARDEHRRRGSSTEGSAPASRSTVGWGGTWQSRWTGTVPGASLLPTEERQE
jgi:hypothetical protein